MRLRNHVRVLGRAAAASPALGVHGTVHTPGSRQEQHTLAFIKQRRRGDPPAPGLQAPTRCRTGRAFAGGPNDLQDGTWCYRQSLVGLRGLAPRLVWQWLHHQRSAAAASGNTDSARVRL